MTRPDQIDAVLAKHFAWSFAGPGVAFDIEGRLRAARASDETSPDADADLDAAAVAPEQADRLPPDERGAERARERARKACEPLALAVEEVWALDLAERADDGHAQQAVRATKRLLARAERLGFVLLGFDEQPTLAVRLVRLLVRHGPRMTRRQRERAAHVATLLPLYDPEVGELLVEVAVSGDREMARALMSDEEWRPELGDELAVAARLADVIDSGPSHSCRVVAIDMLSLLGPAARATATPSVSRALRLPSFAVRGHAMHALATAEPSGVAAADLVQVLRDLALYPPPDALADEEHEDDERLLADALLTALATVRPPEVEEILLDVIDAEHDTMWLDAGWATEALAVAFPETAGVMVDHWLKCAHAHHRMRALGALARLPDELAEPRLVVAASDPAFSVRDLARRQWLERFPRACPAAVAQLVGAGLLEAAPSERFLSRLAVMQGRVRAACRSMARALLAEAPAREALVLLLQLVGDDAESAEPSFAPLDSPDASDAWAPALVRRFGAAGVDGLCALAARFPEPESFGWMRRLGDLVERGVIPREQASSLRDLAARHVASADVGRADDALRVLALLGAPAPLLDRVLSLALDDDPSAPQARALIVSWPDRALDARLASEMALALADRDWPRLEHAAAVGLARGGHGAMVIAGRVLEVAEREEDAVEAAVECARHLRERGALADAWAVEAVRRPESPLFAVAARAWWRSTAVRPGLERALASTARGGGSAVEAALALLHADPPLSPRDRRLPPLLERSGPAARADLLYAMCVHGAPFALVWPYLEGLMVSGDRRVTEALTGVAACLRAPRARVCLRSLLPRVVDAELAADIEEALGAASASFWAEG
jgi:hypothetical protein